VEAAVANTTLEADDTNAIVKREFVGDFLEEMV
jgi:hypothetical protein